MAAPVAVPAPAPVARASEFATSGKIPATGWDNLRKFSTTEASASLPAATKKRVSWDSALGSWKGYGSPPPTIVGVADPAKDGCRLFQCMQSEYAALQGAISWARMVSRFSLGKSQNSIDKTGCNADKHKSSMAYVQFRRSVGLAPTDSLEFPGL